MELISKSILSPSVMNIVQFLKEITEVCHHNFKLSKYFSELHPNSGFEIKIFLKNIDHIGAYHERYECQFFDVTKEEVTFAGCQVNLCLFFSPYLYFKSILGVRRFG